MGTVSRIAAVLWACFGSAVWARFGSALWANVDAMLDAQRGQRLPWAPVLMGAGIGAYFLWPAEPGAQVYLGAVALGSLGGIWAGWRRRGVAVLGWALLLAALGLCLAGARAHRLAAPVLAARSYGPVEGRVIDIDRSASDAPRLTLDRLRLPGRGSSETPARVRVALHGAAAEGAWPVPGSRVALTAHLSPPQGPAEPGGFDFRRHAWFQQLGAVGYTRSPVLVIAAPQGMPRARLRQRLSHALQQALPGPEGGVAAAVLTGDRSAIPLSVIEALRASNLAHLLAISGLHMGLLTGVVFGLLRGWLALIPPFALRWPVRRVAALGALMAAACYLSLSGGNVATERAFVMTAVVLGGLMLDRRAFSLRAVAVAALIVLWLRPESLLGPGFQMSFAATTALIAVFGALRDLRLRIGPRWLAAIGGGMLSSLIAGLATAPVAAAHFNTLSHYGLLANLLAVPVMGLVVIPAAVLAAVLAPFGAAQAGLWIMGLGLRWILGVADHVAALPGAVGHVPAPGPWVLPVLAGGALLLVLWRGPLRFAGLIPMVAAFGLWAGAERPALLVAEDGALVGLMTPQGRALSKPRGAGFVAGIWLENDGDGSDQPAAADRWQQVKGGENTLRVMQAGAHRVIHVTGRRAAAGLTGCDKGDIVVAALPLVLEGECLLLDPARLRGMGAVAMVDLGRDKPRLVTGRPGRRLWSGAGRMLPRDRAAKAISGPDQ